MKIIKKIITKIKEYLITIWGFIAISVIVTLTEYILLYHNNNLEDENVITLITLLDVIFLLLIICLYFATKKEIYRKSKNLNNIFLPTIHNKEHTEYIVKNYNISKNILIDIMLSYILLKLIFCLLSSLCLFFININFLLETFFTLILSILISSFFIPLINPKVVNLDLYLYLTYRYKHSEYNLWYYFYFIEKVLSNKEKNIKMYELNDISSQYFSVEEVSIVQNKINELTIDEVKKILNFLYLPIIDSSYNHGLYERFKKIVIIIKKIITGSATIIGILMTSNIPSLNSLINEYFTKLKIENSHIYLLIVIIIPIFSVTFLLYIYINSQQIKKSFKSKKKLEISKLLINLLENRKKELDSAN